MYVTDTSALSLLGSKEHSAFQCSENTQMRPRILQGIEYPHLGILEQSERLTVHSFPGMATFP